MKTFKRAAYVGKLGHMCTRPEKMHVLRGMKITSFHDKLITVLNCVDPLFKHAFFFFFQIPNFQLKIMRQRKKQGNMIHLKEENQPPKESQDSDSLEFPKS